MRLSKSELVNSASCFAGFFRFIFLVQTLFLTRVAPSAQKRRMDVEATGPTNGGVGRIFRWNRSFELMATGAK